MGIPTQLEDLCNGQLTLQNGALANQTDLLMDMHIIIIFHVRFGKDSDSPGQVEAESERPEKEL
jgi:hypothetical protein